MSFFEVFILALALSVDAFAVAACTGCSLRTVSVRQYFRLGAAFGFFQFMMPVIGWYLGTTVRHFIETWDHWIAFGLLLWIGWNMLRSSLQRAEDCPVEDPTVGGKIFILAVATSIDALAVGLSFALLDVPVWSPSILIGVVCALVTACGLFIGKSLANAPLFSRRAELVGGLVLIGIGVKILYEHGVLD